MFPLIGPLAGFLATAGGTAFIDLLLNLLLRKGGRTAVKALGQKALGRAPTAALAGAKSPLSAASAGRIVRRGAKRAGVLGATFGGIDAILQGLRGDEAGPGTMMTENERSRAFLQSSRTEPDIEQLLAMLSGDAARNRPPFN